MENNKIERTINGYTITYHEENKIYYPDLALPEQTHYYIGKYGQMRLDFLKKHRRGTYSLLVGECRLNEHLHKTEQAAKQMLEALMSELVRSRGITEELKAADQLRWVQEMNAAKHDAEEIVFAELIYS